MSESDWIYQNTGGGTFSTPWGEFAYDAPMSEIYGDIPNPGGFLVADAALPVHNWWARHGVKGTLQQVTPEGDLSAVIQLRKGPAGWWMRRWLRTHPLQLTAQMYRPEWGEWREQTGTVQIEY